MQQVNEQMSLFDRDILSQKMSLGCLAPIKAKTSVSSSKNFVGSKTKMPRSLNLRMGGGGLLREPSWETGIPWLGASSTLNFGECPNVVEESGLWQILETNVPQKFLLSEKACLGVLRRSKNRGKQLPFILNLALTQQIKRGNKNYGEKEIAHAAEILRELWEEVGEETFIKWIRRTVILLQSEEILFPEMCKHCNWEGKSEKGYDISENKPCASKEKHSICTLCFMRENRIYRSSSYRQKPIEQLSKQLDSLMQKLSCKTAPVEGLVLCLRRAGEGAAFMFKALPTIQEVLEKRERSSRIYNKSTAKNAGNVICFSQDAYDKYEEAQHAASLKASGGNYGGGSENLVCAGFHPKAAKTASISYVEGNAPTLQSAKEVGVVYCLQGNGIDRADTAGCNGKGVTENVSYTLNTVDRHAVCCEAEGHTHKKVVRMREGKDGGSKGALVQEDKSGTIACNNDQVLFQRAETQYIVRRLTPLECCRLQGMPDWWLDGVEGSDAARYKLWGNGMALPNALYVMEGIAQEEGQS